MQAERPGSSVRVRWYRSLRWQLFLFNALLLVLLGWGAFEFNERFVRDPLTGDNERLIRASSDGVESGVSALLDQTELLATAVATIARLRRGDDQVLQVLIPGITDDLHLSRDIAAVGVWPEPGAFRRGAERDGRFWLRDELGEFQLRNEYNAPNNISYHGEAWYTAARYTPAGRCFWSGRQAEPLSGQSVIICSTPILDGGQFIGTVTISLRSSAVARRMARASDLLPGHALLFDRGNRLIFAAPELLAGAKPRNVAELAQDIPAYGPLALHLHKVNELTVNKAINSGLYKAESVSRLKDTTRELPRLDAELMLSNIWLAQTDNRQGFPAYERLEFESEPVLNDAASVSVRVLDGPLWKLVVVSPGSEGFGGFGGLNLMSLIATTGMLAVAMMFLFGAFRWAVLKPLDNMLARLRDEEDTEPGNVIFDQSVPNEIGILAYWFNERGQQLRTLRDRLIAAKTQIKPEVDDSVVSALPMSTQATHLDRAFRSLNDALILTNADANIQYMNRAAEVITGWRNDQAETMPVDEVLHLLDTERRKPVRGLVQGCIESGHGTEQPAQAYLQTRSGHQLPITATISPIRETKNIVGASILLQDARALFERLQQTEAGDTRDPLTGLFSRNLFDAELATVAEAVRLGTTPPKFLLYIDVDNLSHVNDVCGTDGGDELLRQLARLIEGAVGEHNKTYRLGGDKFAVLIDSEELSEVEVTAELLRAEIEGWGFRWKQDQFDTTITASIVPIDKQSGRQLEILKNAETACQDAKGEGHNRVIVYRPAPLSRSKRRDDQVWIDHIKRGLAEDCFHLSTQRIEPVQRSLKQDGEFYEVLLLLEDDEGFWASAGAFMPAAERYHLATDLDRWVIHKTFEHLGADTALQQRLRHCSVNISGQSIEDKSFIDFLIAEMERTSIDPHLLCFELTERTINAKLSAAREFVRMMKQFECSFCIEDFSSGMAGAALLKELPVDYIKFSPMLTRRVTKDNADRLAVESLHKIAHVLNKRTIAAQIEDPEAMRILQGIGVDYVQGYAVAKPSPMLFSAAA